MSSCQSRDGRFTCHFCKQNIADSTYSSSLNIYLWLILLKNLRMAAYYPCENNYEKDKSDSLGRLPNELILTIFTHLTVKDLGRCAQVSKKIYTIACDKTLWTKMLVHGKLPQNWSLEMLLSGILSGTQTTPIMPHMLLVQALSRGVKYLGLDNLRFVSTSQPDFPTTNQVEYLALSGIDMDENNFRKLIFSCHNLRKIFVNGTGSGTWKFDDLMKGIIQNSNSLKVLNLSGFCKLNSQDIISIMSKCLNLTEANFYFSSLDVPVSSVINANSAPNIEKLGLSGSAISIKDISTIVTQCNKLILLDLTDARFINEPEHRNIKFPTKIQLESLYMRGFGRGFEIEFAYLEMLIISCENSLKVLDVSYCRNMTPQAIQLVVSRCLHLTTVNFCGLKHTAIICQNLTPTIEKISLSHTDVSNEDFKILVRRCNKIKVLNISHTKVEIDEAIDNIILYLSFTLEKLSLSTCYSSQFSQFDCPLFKLGSMPKLKNLWSFVRYGSDVESYLKLGAHLSEPSSSSLYGLKSIMDLWKKQFPNVVLSCHSNLRGCCYQCYCYPILIPEPNMAITMGKEETIWEIQCEGIELFCHQEDDSEKK